MAKKPVRRSEWLEIVYDKKHWITLKKMRSKAILIMERLSKHHIQSIVHGSLARGDITEKSDIDIFIPKPPSSFKIESILEQYGFTIDERIIVQATPLYALKGLIKLKELYILSFPLVKLRPVEDEFYRFGGEASMDLLKKDIRIPGIDKRLMLIEPNEKGHIESTVFGREKEISKKLNLSLNTVLDRVHALIRRDKIGRTGVFIQKELSLDETFEQTLKKLSDQNPAVRRRINY